MGIPKNSLWRQPAGSLGLKEEAMTPSPRCPTRHRNSAEMCDRWIWCSECGARRFIGVIGEVMWKRWQYPRRGK